MLVCADDDPIRYRAMCSFITPALRRCHMQNVIGRILQGRPSFEAPSRHTQASDWCELPHFLLQNVHPFGTRRDRHVGKEIVYKIGPLRAILFGRTESLRSLDVVSRTIRALRTEDWAQKSSWGKKNPPRRTATDLLGSTPNNSEKKRHPSSGAVSLVAYLEIF